MDQQRPLCLKYSVLCAAILILAQGLAGCASSRHRSGPLTFTVLTVNVRTDDSTNARAGARRIADVIRETDPDIVALQGIRRSVVHSETFDALTALSDMTGMTYAFGETQTDHQKRYGNGFLTRHPILEESNTFFPSDSGEGQNGLLRLVLDVKGKEVVVMTTHLGVGSGKRDIRDLRDLFRLNAPPRLLLASSDKLSDDEISVPLREILADAWKWTGVGQGFTFPAHDPQQRLDFVFFDSGRPGFKAVAARTLETTPLMHLSLMVDFELVAN